MAFLTEAANRGSISTGYDIDNSLSLKAANSEHLYRTMVNGGNRRTWTYSIWFKKSTNLLTNGYCLIHYGVNHHVTRMYISDNDDTIYLDLADTTNNLYQSQTKRRFRDNAAWYHIVWRVDTTQSTAADRSRLYVNGVEETEWTSQTLPPQNLDTMVNTTAGGYDDMGIGTYVWAGSSYDNLFDGYIAQVAHVDGQSYAPTEFGEFDDDSGIWKPKDLSNITWGSSNNSFFLDFEDSSDLGNDSSGNNNDWSLSNVTAVDQATDTPTNNFCTFNPLMAQNNPPTISEGAMKSTGGGGTWNQTWGNIGVKNGKWYYEFKVTNTSSTGYFGASTTPAEGSSTNAASLMYNTSFMVGSAASIDYYYWQNGSQVSNESTGWGGISTNDVIGIALDLDSATKTFTVYKNGTALSGTLSQPVDLPTNMQDEFIFPLYVQYENRQDEANFGGYTTMTISSAATDENGYGTFEYAPPSGYYALCTKNLAEYG